MSNKYQMHIISHTHWDREWYLTFQQYRLRLVDLIDHLLDILDRDKEYKYFTLDGQTIMLEDYLEIRPENRERLKKYIQSGRIFVGPWYILPDEFLVSGESTIRNLMLGYKIAADMGAIMKIGYAPDPFGHISQLPQILQGFGIDNFIFSRGVGPLKKTEFYWQSPDGSKVLAIFQKDMYCNAMNIPSNLNDGIEMFNSFYSSLTPYATTEHILINHGCDHLEPQPDLSDILNKIRKKWNKAEIIQSNLPNYIAEIQKIKPKLDIIKGELRDGRKHYLLYGVLSSRIYLKQKNEQAQTALEKYSEPISVMAYLTGSDYPQSELNHSWKWLLKNQPHDSICGCSIDEVHEQMMTRFAWSQEIADELTNRKIHYLAENINTNYMEPTDTALILFNPLNWSRKEVIRTTVHFPRDMRIKGVRIFNSKGKELPAQCISVRDNMQTILAGHHVPKFQLSNQIEIAFMTDSVPSVGYDTYFIRPYQIAQEYPGEPIAKRNILENEYIRLEFNPNGTFHLYDKKNRKKYLHCHIIEDGADAGDEYSYSPIENDIIFRSNIIDMKIELIENGPVLATVKISANIQLPKKLTADRKYRSRELIPCLIHSYVTVKKGSARVDIRTEFENNIQDHRLRVLFPSGLKSDFSNAESQFDVVTRPIRPPDSKEYSIESAPTCHPQQSFVSLSDGKYGLTLINRGLPEYEIINDTEHTMALTLLRCIGWLSRPDLLTRSDNAGPEFATPGAQCPGTYIFNYAIIPHKGDWAQSDIHQKAHEFNVAFKTLQTARHTGKLSVCDSFIKLEPAGLVMTALKKAENSNAIIIRFFNIKNTKLIGNIILNRKIKSVYRCHLHEKPIEKLNSYSSNKIQIPVNPKKIITLAVELI